MFKNSFSFEGRIRRTEYGISAIIHGAVVVIINLFAGASRDASLVLIIPSLWFFWAQGAKRCHDLGNNGWWQIIPFYGFWLLFQDGELGSNQYGDNPKGIQQSSNYYTYTNAPSQPSSNSSGGYNAGNYDGGHNSNAQGNYYNSNNDSNASGEYKSGDLYK